MKIETKEPKFEPVTITLETQEEVSKMFAIFNHQTLSNALEFYNHYKSFTSICVKDYTKWHNVIESLISKK